MSSSPICNALLRVDGISGEPPSPFERPRRDLDFWVLELPDQNLSVAEWCAQVAPILHRHAERLQQAHLAGGRSCLFVQFSSGVSVLRLEADFLRRLVDLGIALECALDADT